MDAGDRHAIRPYGENRRQALEKPNTHLDLGVDFPRKNARKAIDYMMNSGFLSNPLVLRIQKALILCDLFGIQVAPLRIVGDE